MMQIKCDNKGRIGQGPLVLLSPLTLGRQTSTKKTNETQQMFIEDLVLYICKAYWLISTIENI
jgi:hypothetical protein